MKIRISESADTVVFRGKQYPVKDKSFLNGKLASYANEMGLENIATVTKDGIKYKIYDTGIGNLSTVDKCAVPIDESLTESRDVNKAVYNAIDDVYRELKKYNLYPEIYQYRNLPVIEVDVQWGDWKHDHWAIKDTLEEMGFNFLKTDVTEDDGSDTYSAIHYFMIPDKYYSLTESKKKTVTESTTIRCYDDTAKYLQTVADANDLMVEELVDILIEGYLKTACKENGWKYAKGFDESTYVSTWDDNAEDFARVCELNDLTEEELMDTLVYDYLQEACKELGFNFPLGESIKLEDVDTPETQPTSQNIYGVKVGDIFQSEWGYEQTNVSFYQVRKLMGKQSVMVDEVSLPEVSRRDGFLSADISYDIDTSKEYPKRFYREPDIDEKTGYDYSADFNKRSNNIVKRVKKSNYGIYIDMSSYERAYLVTTNHIDTFQSWWH